MSEPTSCEPAGEEIKRRALRGAASLLTRQLVVRGLGFVGTLLLARILTPEVFGVFAIVMFVMAFFEQLSSLGLAAALLRKREPPTTAEVRTVFTIQQAIVWLVAGTALLGAAPITRHFELAAEFVWLIRALALGLVLASWKTIPTVLLERRLRHDLIATAEAVEFFTYQAVAIVLALRGFEIWALVIAVLSRAAVGTLVLQLLCRWRPGLAFDRRALAEIVRFSVPIQLASFAGMTTNAVIPALVGPALGVAAVGYANFARSILDALLFQPLILMGRVQLRVFASLQEDARRLGRAAERSMYLGSALVFPTAALIVSLADAFVEHVVTNRWSTALPLLYALAPAYLVYAVAQPLMQISKALGDARTPLYGIVLQGAVQIAVFMVCYRWLGLLAYAIGVTCGLLIATALAYRRVRQRIPISIWRATRGPLVAAVLAVLAASAVDRLVDATFAPVLAGLCCLGTYALVLGLLEGRRLSGELADVVTSVLPDSALARNCVGQLAGVLLALHGLRDRLAPGAIGK